MAKKLNLLLVALSLLVAPALLAQRPRPPRPPLPDVDVHFVTVAPPAVRREVIVESRRPAPDYVWVSGYWDWDGDRWGWVEGDWSRPPATSVAWVQPQYVRTGGSWRYVPGHWSSQRVIVVKEKSKVKVKRHHHRYHKHDDDDDDD